MLRQLVFVAPRHVAEDPAKRVGVSLLDPVEDVLEPHANVLVDLAEITPMAALGEHEAVVVGLYLVVEAVSEVGYSSLVLLVPDVADPPEEQQREDIGLEVGRVYWTPKAVGGIPKPAL